MPLRRIFTLLLISRLHLLRLQTKYILHSKSDATRGRNLELQKTSKGGAKIQQAFRRPER